MTTVRAWPAYQSKGFLCEVLDPPLSADPPAAGRYAWGVDTGNGAFECMTKEVFLSRYRPIAMLDGGTRV